MTAAAFVVLTASLLFLTLSGGGLSPSTVVVTAIVVSATALIATFRRSSAFPQGAARPSSAVEIIMAILLLFVLATTIPLPPSLDSVAGERRHSQNQAVTTALQQAAQLGVPVFEEHPWFALTRNRAGTLRFFLLLATSFSALLLVSQFSQKWKTGLLHTLAIFGAAVGIAGFLGQWVFPQGDTLWWFIPIPHSVTSPAGCFLNRNHYGGFVALLVPVALALMSDAASRRRWASFIFYLLVTLVMMAAVCLSLSRGAMLAMAAGVAVTLLIISFRIRLLWGLAILALMLIAAGTLVAKSSHLRDRLEGIHNPLELNSVQSRLAEWRESLRAYPDYAILGAGMNALRMVYPQTRQTSVGARLIHAENEYVQLLAEGGLISVLLTGALIVALRHRSQAAPDILEVAFIATTGAVAVAGVHCLFDFPTRHPLYAFVLGILAGLMVSQPSKPKRIWLPAGICFLGAVYLSASNPETLKTRDDPAAFYQAPYSELQRALVWAPTSPAWHYLGRAMIKEGNLRHTPELCAKGEEFVSRAAELDPQNYRLWYELGQIRLSLNKTERAAEAFDRAHQLRSWMAAPPMPERAPK